MGDTSVLVEMTLLLLVAGAVAGLLAGLLGVGGGIVLVMAFFHVFETLGFAGPQLMQICLATSLATIVVTSARSEMAHDRPGAVDWAILRGWGPGIVIGAGLGVLVAAALTSQVLQLLFGGLAMLIGLYMAFGRPDWRIGSEVPQGLMRAAIAPVIGLLSVLMGIGGGSFGVPLMTLFGSPIHQAVATAAGFGMLIAVPSVLGFLFVTVDPATRPPWTIGAVNLPAFAIIIAMTLLTTPLGARLAHRMNPKPLRRVFAIFLVVVALNMLRKAAGW